MTKIHIPNGLYKKAKQLQQEYDSKGLRKPLYECLQELEDGFAGRNPSVSDIRRAVEDALSKHLPGGSSGSRGAGPENREFPRWLG